MSRQVIHDIVIPIVSRIMAEEGYVRSYQMLDIRDPTLEEFLEEEMRRSFGVIGANGCQHLKEQMEEAKKNDPFAFEQVIRQALRKYIELAVKVRQAEEERDSPPDRFSEQRKKYPLLGYHLREA